MKHFRRTYSRLYTILLIISVLLGNKSIAQNDVSLYFDDGGISKSSCVIKIGYDPLNGEIPIFFEHPLGGIVSMEWGIGPVLLSQQSKLYADIESSDGLGLVFSANARLYMNEFLERFYLGFNPRVCLLEEKVYLDIVFASFGYQVHFANRFVFDFNLGAGLRNYKQDPYYVGQVKYEFGRISTFVVPI